MVFPPPHQLFLILGFILASACAQSSEIVALLQRFGRLESVRATFARLAASHLVLVALRRANDAVFTSGGSGLRPIVVSGGGLRGRQQCWPFCACVCVDRRYWGKKGVFLAGSQRET